MIWILTFHAHLHYGYSAPSPWINVLVYVGAIAVTGFFMISGFTLRYGYKNRLNDPASIKKYYKNRIIGIYPVYLFLLILSYVLQYNMEETLTASLELLPLQLSLMQTFFYPQFILFSFNNNFWYISVAFVLYLIFPALNYLANQMKRPWVWILVFSLISCYQFWVHNYEAGGGDYYFYYYNPIFRIPEFFVGVLVCDAGEKMQKRVRFWVVFPSIAVFYGLLVLCYQTFLDRFNMYNIIMIPLMIVLLLACQKDTSVTDRIAGNRVISYLASLGLNVYICQSVTLMIIEKDYFTVSRFYDKMPVPYLFMLMTFAVSVSVNLIIERPCKYLLKKVWVK